MNGIEKIASLLVLLLVTVNLNAQSLSDTSVIYYYAPDSPERNDVLSYVEKEAEYPGGYHGLIQFFSKKLKYPKICTEMGISSKIHLRLIIEKDGTVSLIQIRLRKDFDCLQEMESQLADWLNEMPKWMPAYQNGEPVACIVNLPMIICLG